MESLIWLVGRWEKESETIERNSTNVANVCNEIVGIELEKTGEIDLDHLIYSDLDHKNFDYSSKSVCGLKWKWKWKNVYFV